MLYGPTDNADVIYGPFGSVLLADHCSTGLAVATAERCRAMAGNVHIETLLAFPTEGMQRLSKGCFGAIGTAYYRRWLELTRRESARRTT